MSVQTNVDGELSEDDLSNISKSDVSFEQMRNVLHGGYKQSEGTIFSGVDEYSVKITERDESYHIQVRDSNQSFVAGKYINSTEPYEELPENDSELYQIIVETDWELQ